MGRAEEGREDGRRQIVGEKAKRNHQGAVGRRGLFFTWPAGMDRGTWTDDDRFSPLFFLREGSLLLLLVSPSPSSPLPSHSSNKTKKNYGNSQILMTAQVLGFGPNGGGSPLEAQTKGKPQKRPTHTHELRAHLGLKERVNIIYWHHLYGNTQILA